MQRFESSRPSQPVRLERVLKWTALEMPRHGGISHIRAGLGVRKLATEAGFRPTVSERDILVSRFLERHAEGEGRARASPGLRMFNFWIPVNPRPLALDNRTRGRISLCQTESSRQCIAATPPRLDVWPKLPRLPPKGPIFWTSRGGGSDWRATTRLKSRCPQNERSNGSRASRVSPGSKPHRSIEFAPDVVRDCGSLGRLLVTLRAGCTSTGPGRNSPATFSF
jgi:hypothetical protein